MIKKHLICSFLLLTFGFLHISEVQAQGFLERFWQNNKKHIAFVDGYDDNLPFYIGISGEFAYSHYSIEKAADWNTISVNMPIAGDVDNFSSITAVAGGELGLGIPIRIRLNQRASVSTGVFWFPSRGGHRGTNRDTTASGIRLEYAFNKAINDKMFQYQQETNSTNSSEFANFKTLEVPLHFKIYSDQKYWSQNSKEPYRVYLLGGVRFIRNLYANKFNKESSNFNKVSAIPLNFKKSYYNLEGGLGYDLYSRYFKASVELRYSESIGDLLDRDRYSEIKDKLHTSTMPGYTNPHMDAIHRLSLRGWRLSIILE